MNQEFIDELIGSLKKFKKILKKNILMDNDNTILFKDIMSDIVILNSNINQYIIQFKCTKNKKQIDELLKEQNIHQKIIEKFLPAIIAYSILLNGTN